MNKPKAVPILTGCITSHSVCAGSQRLPGAEVLVMPSNITTTMIRSVLNIPRIDAYESHGRGRKTVGRRTTRPSSLKVLDE